MKYKDYLKDNIIGISIYIGTILFIGLMLNAFKLDYSVIILTIVILLISGTTIITINFYRKNIFYKEFFNNLDKLSKKYLILETIPEPTSYEEKLMVNSFSRN